MLIQIDTTDPDSFIAFTGLGLRAFDRYHRNRVLSIHEVTLAGDDTLTLAASEYHRVDDDQTPPSAAQVTP